MDTTDTLQALAAAQAEAAKHMAEAARLASLLPHGPSALLHSNTVMGNIGSATDGSPCRRTAAQLAEELYSGTSNWGPSIEELMPPVPMGRSSHQGIGIRGDGYGRS